jgi:hypothetical protein
MISFFRLRFFPAGSSFWPQIAALAHTLIKGRSLALLTTQIAVVSGLAVVLWMGSVGTYTPVAQAADQLDGRAYEAEAVRQSRNPASRTNGAMPAPGEPSGLSQAPEDQAQGILDNVKDAVQDFLPGQSPDSGKGQNAYNPNTPPGAIERH